jgi:ribonuclease R
VPKTRSKPAPFPSKEEVLRYIQENPKPVGKREIARAFKIRGPAREELKALLGELADEGHIERGRHRRVSVPGRLPAVAVIEVVDIDVDGEPIARPASWQWESPPPRILVTAPARGPRVVNLHSLGIGDRMLARLNQVADALYEAKPIRVFESAPTQVIGVYAKVAGTGRLHPTDRRVKRDFVIPAGESGEARPGELVIGETLPGRSLGLPRARVTERLGALDAPRAISLLAIHSHGIPVSFADEALAQAEAGRAAALDGRADLRAIPLVTIDGPDARDFDDAVWAEPDPKSPGGWHLLVAIADVAHYVRAGDALDRASAERGNSVYFPDRVVPMLPEALSNGLCSLKPGEERACLAVDIWIDAEGRTQRHRFRRGLMRSAARLTYVELQAAADRGEDRLEAAPVGHLYGAYRALAAARRRRGALEIELPEPLVVLDGEGNVVEVTPAVRYDSHRLIEEFMIAANVCAAEGLERKESVCIYRVHDQPALSKLESLRTFLATLGLKLTRGRALKPDHFNQILKKVAGTPHEHLINLVVLRAQAKATYGPENIGHFGLGLRRYCHFTSPIRRYADLLVHRALIRALNLGPGGLPEGSEVAFAELGAHLSQTERRADAAERDANDRYMTAYLAERVGARFSARISGVTRFGLFVALHETGAEGLVPMRRLGRERLTHDEASHALVGRKRVYRLGDTISVRLAEADRITGSLLFEPVEPGTR